MTSFNVAVAVIFLIFFGVSFWVVVSIVHDFVDEHRRRKRNLLPCPFKVVGLAVLLLAAASVEAGASNDENAVTYTMEGDSIDNIIATCDEHYRNCQVLMPEAFPCYQKMQQAMSAMDESHIIKPYRPKSAAEKEQEYQKEGARLDHWSATMRECVQ